MNLHRTVLHIGLNLSLCLQMVSGNSLSQNVFFEKISFKEGLYQNTVSDITQDNDGFLWLGTPKGLIKYDGLNFKVFEQYELNGNVEPIKRVYALHLDKDGNIWAGASSGIYKYDQRKEKILKVDSSNISFDQGNQFIFTPEGEFFVWATNGVFSMIGSDTIKTVPVGLKKNQSIKGKLESLHHIRDSLYIFGINSDMGTCTYSSATNQFNPLALYPEYLQCKCLCKETESILWLGFSNGIKRFKLSEKGELEELDFSYYKGHNLLNNNLVNDIFKASDGNIYAATTGNGVVRINTAEQEIEVFRYNEELPSISWDNVFCIFEDHTGILWFGTGQGGLTKYDTHRKPFYHLQHNSLLKNTLSHNHVNSILVDSQKHLWAGTFYSGLNVSKEALSHTAFKDLTFEVLPLRLGVNNQGLYGLFEIDGNIAISNGQNVYFYNLLNRELYKVPANSILGRLLQNVQVICFEKDHKNRLWLGCNNTIFCLDYNNNINNLIKGNVSHVEIISDNNTSEFELKVNKIYCSSENKILIATENGFYIAKEQNNKITLQLFQHKIGNPNTISQNEITSIFEDDQKRIWLGTFNGGLNQVKFNDSGEVVGFLNFQNGINLPENSIFCIESDDTGNLWLSSYNGIYKYNISSNLYTNYSTSDGLTTNLFHKFSSYKTDDGMLIFGNVDGLTAFYPNQITTNTSFPIVSITNLKIFNKPVKINEKLFGKVILPQSISGLTHIELPYKCNVITLEFMAIHMSSPLKNTFYYKLEGIDQEWIKTSIERNFANYTNLYPGDYKFQITASNADGIKSDEILELGITILPPWYLTKLALILFGIAALGIFYMVFHYLKKLAFLRHALQIEKLEKEKEKEIYDAKQRFFTNISHELKTPLSLILGPIEKISKNITLNESDRRSFQIIVKNANRLYRLINQIMDFRKLEQNKIVLSLVKNDINNLIRDIASFFEDELSRKNQQLAFNAHVDTLHVWYDQDKIEKVIFNILSNAIKHTPRDGQILIETNLSKTKNQAVLKFTNQGVGVPNEDKKRIFERFYQVDITETGTGIGLAMAKSFVELHQGTIIEKGKFGKNAVFKISLPVKPDLQNSNFEFQESEKLSEAINATEVFPEIRSKDHEPIDREVILVVEDNVEMLEFISDTLSERYIVLKANDGAAGFELAEKEIPEIIITDVMMPNIEGTEFCRLIKENQKTSHIPVIMLTAKDTLEQQIEGLHAGADAYLTKPFHMSHLYAQIENLLESRKKIQQSFKQKYGLGINNLEITPVDEQLIKRFVLFIEENISDPNLRVADAAREMSYSYVQFNRKMQAITGETVGQFLNNYRLNRAKQIFEADPGRSISEVMYSVGFKNSSYFSKCFKEQFDLAPKEFKLTLK